MTVIVKHHPSGGPADPSALVDGPTYDTDPHIVTGLAASATTDTTNATNITAGTISRPINQTQAVTGTVVGTLPANLIEVSDNALITNSTTDSLGRYTPEGWCSLSGLTVNWSGSGANATGGRTAILANAFLSTPSALGNTANDFYASYVGTCNIYSDDNGTVGTPLGAAFGIATVTYLKSTVKHWVDLFGAEFDVVCETGGGVQNKVGVLVSQTSTDGVQGTNWDAGYLLQGFGPGWRQGYCAASDGIHNPFSSDGSLLCTYGPVTMANAIDVSSGTVTGFLFKSKALNITGAGVMTLSANASATLPVAFTGELAARFVGADGARARVAVDSFGTGVATSFSTFNLRRANGTGAAPTAVQSGNLLFGYVGTGYGTTAFLDGGGAGITGWATQTFTDSVGGCELRFVTTPNGAIANVEAGVALNSGQLNWHFPVSVLDTTAIPAGGTTGAGLKMSSTANFGVFFGSGVPTLSAAKSSLYLRSDGSSTSTRMYVNTDGATTWTNVVTAA